MIKIRANAPIKAIFDKTIKIMEENVEWGDTIVIHQNRVILVGKIRSLVFQFDNQRILSTIVDFPEEKFKLIPIINTPLLENIFNIILYIFGKWGVIKGLTVEKNYIQLDRLMNEVLAEILVEVELTHNSIKFIHEKMRVTFEDVVEMALKQTRDGVQTKDNGSRSDQDSQKVDDQSQRKEKQTDIAQKSTNQHGDDEDRKYHIGLWHDMVWTENEHPFEKMHVTHQERKRERPGKGFYLSNYQCPQCQKKLFMTVFAEGKEFKIETVQESVYLARVYTCTVCRNFYTPIPHQILMEGEVFELCFDEDENAYLDYMELLGKEGSRTSNGHFNFYESECESENGSKYGSENGSESESQSKLEYGSKNNEPETLKQACQNLEGQSDEQIIMLKDKMDSFFYPEKDNKKFEKTVENQMQQRHIDENLFFKKLRSRNRLKHNKNTETNHNRDITIKTKALLRTNDTNQNNNRMVQKGQPDSVQSIDGAHASQVQIEAIPQIRQQSVKSKSDQNRHKQELLDKAAAGKNMDYHGLSRLLQEVDEMQVDDHLKKPVIDFLNQLKIKKKEQELEVMIQKAPQKLDKISYQKMLEQLRTYDESDASKFAMELKKKRIAAEKQELSEFLKTQAENQKSALSYEQRNHDSSEKTQKDRKKNVFDRKRMADLYDKIQQMGFSDEVIVPVLNTLHNKMYDSDKEVLHQILPDVNHMSFREGVSAYETIQNGIFLPELKADILSQINKRLIMMKADECEQLVKKLAKDMNWEGKRYPGMYLTNVMNFLNNIDDSETRIIQNVFDSLAPGREKYEYPVLTFDAPILFNAREGFVLTPDHLYYKTVFASGVLNVSDIESMWYESGILKTGVYIHYKNVGDIKICSSLSSIKQNADASLFVAEKLMMFINYLKQKPQSREIEYMIKTKHLVKCCYRCGFLYKDALICPQCGSKNNE